MKFILTGLFLISGVFGSATVFASTPDKSRVVLGIISGQSKAQFEEQIMPILKEQTSACANCEIRNLSPYNDKMEFDQSKLNDQLSETSMGGINFLVVNWNSRYHPELEPVVESLKKLIAKDVIIIGAAGIAKANENLIPLSRTVLGQVPDLVIIGELEERERLLNHGYFGPEMLTAIKPPKEFMGLGFTSLFFGSKLANNWNKKSSEDWLTHFKQTKSKTRRLWPALNDFFGGGSSSEPRKKKR